MTSKSPCSPDRLRENRRRHREERRNCAELRVSCSANRTRRAGGSGWPRCSTACAIVDRTVRAWRSKRRAGTFLAIVELSEAGRQPMASGLRTFNSELYKFRWLRTALSEDGYRESFRGQSDSEVVLAAIALWDRHTSHYRRRRRARLP